MQSAPAAENLAETSPFHFACHDALPCFTQCCRDVNIYLTPYDVLRLRKFLAIGSYELLSTYTRSFLAKDANIPVVQLLMDPKTLYCPFVTEEGCRVYEDRPWACRMFPLDLLSDGQYRLMAGKERCQGLYERPKGSVGEWLEAQGLPLYSEKDAEFQSVFPRNFTPRASMSEDLGRVLFLAYDLDRFAEFLSDSQFLELNGIDEQEYAQVQDMEALLKLAYRFIRAKMNEFYKLPDSLK